MGKEFLELANQFARSHEREMVRRRAEQTDVSNLDAAKFMGLLSHLFQVRKPWNDP